jgi:CubicO group peptidase (beta-lactamase class C family)
MTGGEMRGEQVGAVLDDAVSAGHLAGVAASAWTRSGLLYEGAAGTTATGDAMELDSLVWIASMTKAVTAVAVMQLIERGTLRLDQRAGELVPYLDEVQVLAGFDEDGTARLRSPTRPVTLLHLLTHTSGFGYSWTDESLARHASTIPVAPPGSQASYERPLIFDPGDGWAYGTGLDWAGRVVEAASGQRLDEYFAEHIFEPLGMIDTTFLPSPEQAPRLTGMHQRTDGKLVASPPEPPTEVPEMLSGGGGLYSTVIDYARFTRMVLGRGELDGRRVLWPSSVELMARDHLDGQEPRGWTSTNAFITNDVDLLVGQHAGWGLSFLRNSIATEEGRSAGSLFWGGLANTYYWIDLDAGVTGVFATQVLPFYDAQALGVFSAFERSVYAAAP